MTKLLQKIEIQGLERVGFALPQSRGMDGLAHSEKAFWSFLMKIIRHPPVGIRAAFGMEYIRGSLNFQIGKKFFQRENAENLKMAPFKVATRRLSALKRPLSILISPETAGGRLDLTELEGGRSEEATSKLQMSSLNSFLKIADGAVLVITRRVITLNLPSVLPPRSFSNPSIGSF